MKQTLSLLSLSLGLLLSGGAYAANNNYTLTFDANAACGANSACADWSPISQSYGDVAGIVDVSYIDGNNTGAPMTWWSSNYNDLNGIAWIQAGGGDANSHARIELSALNGSAITLNSMDFGAWSNTSRNTNILVTNADTGATLFSYTGSVGNGLSHNTFAPGATAQRIWLDWSNSAYNVGIDNVNFTVAAVPEPETYAMFFAGLGLMGFIARRRKQHA